MLALMWLRQRLPWWPVHPIGLPIGGTPMMNRLWFNVFVAWVVKQAVMRYGGAQRLPEEPALLSRADHRTGPVQRRLAGHRLLYRRCGGTTFTRYEATRLQNLPCGHGLAGGDRFGFGGRPRPVGPRRRGGAPAGERGVPLRPRLPHQRTRGRPARRRLDRAAAVRPRVGHRRARDLPDHGAGPSWKGAAACGFSIPARSSTSTDCGRTARAPRPPRPEAWRACSPGPGAVSTPISRGGNWTGRVVLMEFNTWDRWVRLAALGARAVIFIEPEETSYPQTEDKSLNVPVDVPRFWIGAEEGRRLRRRLQGGDEIGVPPAQPDGLARAAPARTSGSRSRAPTRPWRGQRIVVQSYYDGTLDRALPGALGRGLRAAPRRRWNSPRYLRDHPPARTVVVLLTGSHFQDRAGIVGLPRAPHAQVGTLRRAHGTRWPSTSSSVSTCPPRPTRWRSGTTPPAST